MREIKFRAWHKTKKAFLRFELSELNDSMITKVEDGWYLDDCEIMQFTGIKAPSGQDIYEGDIVQYDAIDTYGVVTWINNGPGFVIINPEKSGVFVLHSEWEIIGTIYEHSAFLEGWKHDVPS